MTPSERRDFLSEIEAMNETFVRQKHTSGGYQGVQAEIVERYLKHLTDKRVEELSRQQLAATQWGVFWNKLMAYGTLASVFVALCVWLWPKK